MKTSDDNLQEIRARVRAGYPFDAGLYGPVLSRAWAVQDATDLLVRLEAALAEIESLKAAK